MWNRQKIKSVKNVIIKQVNYESFSSLYKHSHKKRKEVAIFRCFDVCSVRPSQIFKVQTKISTVRPVFRDYLSVSYDYGISIVSIALLWYLALALVLALLCFCGDKIKHERLSKHLFQRKQQHGG